MNFIYSKNGVSNVCILNYQRTQGKGESPPDFLQETGSGTRILSTALTLFGFHVVKQFHFSLELFVHWRCILLMCLFLKGYPLKSGT